ncbi:MAG: potassium-transporting ATPase subunit B, partial [Methylococcales bacterium]
MHSQSQTLPGLDRRILLKAIVDSLGKLRPLDQLKNPVMFVVYVGSILSTISCVHALIGHAETPFGFTAAIAFWLWFTVLFANFAEAMAEGRSKAQAVALRGAKRDILAKKLEKPRHGAPFAEV